MLRLFFSCLYLTALCLPVSAEDWLRFRGPNGAGISPDAAPTVRASTQLWRTDLPPGVSSPAVVDGRVVVTAVDGDDLVTLALDIETGERLWRSVAPRSRREQAHPRHNAATPSPAADADSVYVFFPDFGLVAYALDGKERWRAPLGPFSSVQGLGGSPIVEDGLVILLVDQAADAYIAAFDATTGEQRWRRSRPVNFLGGYSTPVIMRPADGPTQVIAAGSVEMTAYQLSTGETLWRNPGWLAPVSVPVLVDGAIVGSEPLNQAPPPFDSVQSLDKNGDGYLSLEDVQDAAGLTNLVRGIDEGHGDGDGKIDAKEWNRAFDAFGGAGGMRAIRLGATGELGDDAVAWRYTKSLPYLPSILSYQGIVYAVRQGGVLTAVDAATGEPLKQGRLRDAIADYTASPVAAGGMLYLAAMDGKITTVRAGREWEALETYDLGEGVQATPALSDGRIFVRTAKGLYCFGSAGSAG